MSRPQTHVTLIFPHQLYKDSPALQVITEPGVSQHEVWLIEDPLFFFDAKAKIKFHKQKLALHRASMRAYADRLQNQGYTVRYVEYEQIKDWHQLAPLLKKAQATHLHVVNVTDDWLHNRLEDTAKESTTKLTWYESPNFLTSQAEVTEYLSNKKKLYHHHFYTWQRKRLDVLLEADGSPVGGKWSFDDQNREPLDEDVKIPCSPVTQAQESKSKQVAPYVKEAKKYVQQHFADHPGSIEKFVWPITHEQAEDWWQTFLQDRFKQFGPYEDAISTEHDVLFHSVITPALNIGLLDPQQILEDALAYAKKNNVPINSLEGFVRQIIGWREFIRGVYLVHGRAQRSQNFFDHQRTLTKAWYNGSTGLVAVDQTIEQLQATAYCHHIERLMVLGNAMLLSELHPKEVYRWFMEMFIDSYDWVMVPNVYGMSQYADGGQMVTKPYVSGSRYVRKMSNYPPGDWTDVWDALFWNFIGNHAEYLSKEARMGMLVSTWQRMSDEKRNGYRERVQGWMERDLV